MSSDKVKNLTLTFSAPICLAIGLVSSIITISTAVADISVWVSSFVALFFSILFALAVFFYIKKCAAFRISKVRGQNLVRVFEKTHTTWHVFKRLSDSIHEGFELDSAVLAINKSIINIIGNFRDALRCLHPENTFRISMKAIAYKNIKSLDNASRETYINEPFQLVDLQIFRDAAEGASRREDIIHKLDFDEQTNAPEMKMLKQTLFYQCFTSKDVVFVDEFSEIQQEYTKKYKSGLVAPIVLHGIPFAFICVGSEKSHVFSEDDRELVCTFADALSEYIRFERIFSAIQKSRKVVVMKDTMGLLEDVKRMKQLDENRNQKPSGEEEHE